MSQLPAAGAFEYLKTQAVARLYLDNIPNIQSSWVTQGEKIGQVALSFGANDMGSLMIEENVVSQAGTVFHLTLDSIRRCITDAGYTPRQRNVFYELIDGPAAADSSTTTPVPPCATDASIEEDEEPDLTRSIDLGVQFPAVM
jgi:cyclic dehypoxanthinyl futalosine synthase